MKKILLFILLIFSLNVLVGCKDPQVVKPEVNEVNKISLKNDLMTTKTLMSNVIRDENIALKFKGFKYLNSQIFDEVTAKLLEIENAFSSETMTQEEVFAKLREVRSLQVKVVSNVITETKEGLLLPDAQKISQIFKFDYTKYPQSWSDYFYNYVDGIKESLLMSIDLDKDMVTALNKVSVLISFMDKELLNENTFDPNNEVYLTKNPFPSSQPKFIKIPDPSVAFVLYKGHPENILASVEAVNAKGEDISSQVFFVQPQDIYEKGMYYSQIGVRDDFGNETFTKEYYKITVTTLPTAPTIRVRQESEITSQAKARTTDIRSYVDLTDYLGFQMPMEQVEILYIYDDKGGVYEPEVSYNLVNQTIPENGIDVRDFDSINEIEILNDVKFLNAKLKEITLPYLNDSRVIEWQIDTNPYLEFSSRIEDDTPRTTLKIVDLPLEEVSLNLIAKYEGVEKSFVVKVLPQIKQEILALYNIGTFTIGFKGVDLEGNYSKQVEKELIILPPSRPAISDLVEVSNILPDYKTFNIADFDELLTSFNNDEFKYYLHGNYPLQTKQPVTSPSEYEVNENAKIILFDEGLQFIDDRFKLDGFHQMTYDLMPYLDGFVPAGNQSSIIIPNQALTNMFHRNGVKVYGYINIPFSWEGGAIADIEKLMTKNGDGNYKYLDVISNIAKTFGLDGWAITIRTGFYSPKTIGTLPQAEILTYNEQKEAATKRMNEEVIPFINAFYAHLKANNLTSIYQTGISSDGAVHNTTIYSSDHDQMSAGADIVVTGTLDKRPSTIGQEVQAVLNSGKELDQFYKGIFGGYKDANQFTRDDFAGLLHRDTMLGKVLDVEPTIQIDLNQEYALSTPKVYEKYNLEGLLEKGLDYKFEVTGSVDNTQEGVYKVVYKFTNRYNEVDKVEVIQLVTVGNPTITEPIVNATTTDHTGALQTLIHDGKGNAKLLTSIALYNISWNLFNIKTHNSNYNRLDPKSAFNLYQANDYFAYQEKISKLIGNNLDVDPLISVMENIGTNDENWDNFYLSRLVKPSTSIISDKFYTKFNQANGYYYFINAIKNQDFTNNETWNSDGGVNNQQAQDIVPTYHFKQVLNNPSTGNRLDVGYYFEDAYLGFNSLRVNGDLGENDNQKLWLYETVINLENKLQKTAKLSLKINDITKVKVYLLLNNERFEIIASESNTWQEVAITIPETISKVERIGFEFEAVDTAKFYTDIKIGSLFVGDATDILDDSKPINNLEINQLGYKYNIFADAMISFDKLAGNNKYVVYQKNLTGQLEYLTESYENYIIVKNIKRFSNNPVNPKFPTIEEYDKVGVIVVKAYDEVGNLVGTTEQEFSWPNELVKGGKAQVRLSSTIAKSGEAIVFTPILSPLTESFVFEFGPGANAFQIPGTNQWIATWETPGFYSFKYTTSNPYGVDVLEMENAIIISNDVPSESDLTPDAFIDDSPEMADIKYSKVYANLDERPRYLIDEGPNGGPNLHTKWCGNDKGPGQRWVIIDFQEAVTISRFVLHHAASSLSTGWDQNVIHNTIEYEIYVSEDGVNWQKVVHRENNNRTITEDILFSPVRAKHVKLNVVNGGDDITARIYDLRIFGTR